MLGEIIRKARRHCTPTKPEQAVQKALDEASIQYIAQHPIGPFLIDFFLPAYNTALEVDGVYWHSRQSSVARDKSKNAYLKKCGHNVVRVTDVEVLESSDLVSFIASKLTVFYAS